MKKSGGTPWGLANVFVLICGLSVLGWTTASANTAVPAQHASSPFLTTPLSFEANVGQVEAPVHFLARAPGYGVFLTPTEAVLVMQHPTTPTPPDSLTLPTAPPPAPLTEATLRLRFVGTKGERAAPAGRNPLPGQSHYFLGADPTRWHPHVPHYAQVVYEDLYPGIDLVYYGRAGQLEYDLVVAPGANPYAIELQVKGAETITLTPEGTLRIETAVGDVLQHPPVIYQEYDGVKQRIAGAYRVAAPNRVSFTIAGYDPTRPLYIDPVLSYASYVASDGLYSLARDPDGNLYLTGAALPSFPTVNGVQSQHQGYRDAFVSKLDPTGTTLLYATYLGGSLDDLGRDLAVDASGHAYVVGISSSTDFPTANAFQAKNAGSYDVFVAMLSPSGASLEYATYLGGSGEDGLLRGLALALDAQGNAYLTGTTNSTDFPTRTPFQATYGGAVDAFVAKVGSAGSALLYATYLGGTSTEYGGDLAVDGIGQAYVVGTTFSPDFPTVTPLQPTLGGERDLFITKFTSDGKGMVYSTYLGGTAQDEGRGLTINGDGHVYVTGHTHSPDYPVVHPVQATLAGGADVIMSHLDASGATLVSSTYVGGVGQDKGIGIAVDASSQVYVTGSTGSADFPLTANAAQSTPGMAGEDAFVLKLPSTGEALLYSTYLGGDGADAGQAITVDETHAAFVVGTTGSSDFPRTGPFQATPSGGFVAKLSETAPQLADLTLTMVESSEPVEQGTPLTYTLTVTNNGPDPATGVTVSDTVSPRFRVESVSASQGTCQEAPVVCLVGNLNPGSQATITLTGTPLAVPWTLTNRASVLSDLPDPTIANNSMKLTTEVTVQEGGGTADLSLIKNDDTDPATIGAPFRYTLTVTNHGPDTAPEIIVTETLPPDVSGGSATPSQGTCAGSRELICALGSLAAGAGATVTIDVIPTNITTLLSQAQVTSAAADPAPDNNRDSETTLVKVVPQQDGLILANLSLSIEVEESPVETNSSGTGILQWKVTVRNGGPSPAGGVVVNGFIPDAVITDLRNLSPMKSGEEMQSSTCVPLECGQIENIQECQNILGIDLDFLEEVLVFTCDAGNMDFGQTFTLDVAAAFTPGDHSVTASVSTASTDEITGDNSATSSGTVVARQEEPEPAPAEGGGCFIATAAFGSPLAKEVQILRHFRDQYLLPHRAGQLLVQGYYYSSPPMAAIIEQQPLLKQVVRLSLWPVVWWAHLSLEAPFLAFVVLLGWLMLSLSLLYWMIRFWQRNGFYAWGGRW